jgi:glucose-6-phosphate 1-epimerase
MPEDGWRHMLCVEAAQVFEPITLPAGERWEGWQQLTLTTP